MNQSQLIKRLALLKQKPDVVKPLATEDIAELILSLLSHIKELDTSIKQGRLKGDKGDDGKTPEPDLDYMSRGTALKLIQELFEGASERIELKLAQVQDGLDGRDAEITEEQIQEAARRAFEMVTLPNFEELITAEPTAIRDALELLQGDERLEQSAIKNLPETIDELREGLTKTTSMAAAGLPRNAVQAMIDASVQDSSGDMTWVKETPAGTINGVNGTFQLDHEPIPGTLNLSLGRQLMIEDVDYTLNGTTVIYITPPPPEYAGEPHIAQYAYIS